ncbi:hypothetical protein KCU81_g703, partial [Aureobasidium melanogenum]
LVCRPVVLVMLSVVDTQGTSHPFFATEPVSDRYNHASNLMELAVHGDCVNQTDLDCRKVGLGILFEVSRGHWVLLVIVRSPFQAWIIGNHNSSPILGDKMRIHSGCTPKSTPRIKPTPSLGSRYDRMVSAFAPGGALNPESGSLVGMDNTTQVTCGSSGKFYLPNSFEVVIRSQSEMRLSCSEEKAKFLVVIDVVDGHSDNASDKTTHESNSEIYNLSITIDQSNTISTVQIALVTDDLSDLFGPAG